MSNSYNTKDITEGAVLTALFLVLAITTYYTPLFLFAFVILPTPYIVILVRTNYKIFIMSAVVGGSLLFTLVDPFFTLVMVTIAWIIGGSLGYAYKYNWPAAKNLILASFTVLAIFLIIFVLMQIALDIDIIEELMETFQQAFQNQVDTLESIGAPEDQIQEFQNMEELIREQMVIFIPATLIAFAILSAYLQIMINGKVLSKLGFTVTHLPAFRNWRFPTFFSGFFVVSAILLLFQTDLYGYWGMLAANLFVVSNYILLIQGLAFGFWFLKVHKQLATFLVVLLIFLGLILPILNMAIVLVGIMDQMLNLRQKIESKA